MFVRRLYNKLRTRVPVLPPPPPPEQPIRLYKLDRSSTQFPEQLNELLQDHEWVEGLKFLPEAQLVDLIGYLDDVRFISMLTKSCSPVP